MTDFYLSNEVAKGIVNNYWEFENAPGLEKIKVKSAYIKYEGKLLTVKMPFDIVTEFWCMEEGFPVNVSMHLYDINNTCIFNISTINKSLEKGLHKAVFHIPADFMNDGNYYVSNYFVTASKSYFVHENANSFITSFKPYFIQERANSFEIADDRENTGWYGKWTGAIRPMFIQNDYHLIATLEK